MCKKKRLKKRKNKKDRKEGGEKNDGTYKNKNKNSLLKSEVGRENGFFKKKKRGFSQNHKKGRGSWQDHIRCFLVTKGKKTSKMRKEHKNPQTKTRIRSHHQKRLWRFRKIGRGVFTAHPVLF